LEVKKMSNEKMGGWKLFIEFDMSEAPDSGLQLNLANFGGYDAMLLQNFGECEEGSWMELFPETKQKNDEGKFVIDCFLKEYEEPVVLKSVPVCLLKGITPSAQSVLG
jgi:hypothetical protein